MQVCAVRFWRSVPYQRDCEHGIAGSLRAEINIGDIVVSTDAVQHDMDARDLDTGSDRFRE